LKGATTANETRRYHVYFDVTGGSFTLPNFTDLVNLTDNVSHKGYQSVRVVTADAEYFYHKPGGGFATLLDANGNDWIGWNTANGGAGDFRGIPNMVHPNDGGYFHPGRNNSSTTVLSDGPLKASFRSVSNNGAWEVLWELFPDYARMTVLKQGSANFWWLYEGTPGGAFQPSVDRLTRSNGDSILASGTWSNDIPGDEWLFVTDPNVGRSLYLIHHQEDTKVDGYKPDNSNAMTIFGFGRSDNVRQLTGLPQQFTLGLTDQTTLNGVQPVVNDAYKPLVVTVADDPGEPGCDGGTGVIYVSPKSQVTVDGSPYADEDVLKYDAATCEWSSVFDGTAEGLPASANVDALAVDGTNLYLSFLNPVTVPGIGGQVDDSDVVRFNGSTFSLWLDASTVGLSTNAEDVDAIAFDETGKLLVSTLGAYVVNGLPKGQDEDLLRLNGATWELRFDGSHNAGLAGEDIVGASVSPAGDFYLSLAGAFNVGGGVSGNGADIIKCVPSSLGQQSTNCAYSLFWDSVDNGLTAFDAIDVK
jgi:hypothetical protein